MPPKIKYAPPARSRERIITFGMAGVGKTKAAVQIMDQCVGDMWVIETDNTYDEFLEAYPNITVQEEWIGQRKDDTYYNDPNGKVRLFRVRNWVDYCWAIQQCFTRAQRDDWIFIDNVTNLWDEVQTWFVTEAYGKSPSEFAVGIRKKQIAAGQTNHTVTEEQFTDWGAINPTYFENVKKFISSPPCHLMMMAEQDTISTDGKQKIDKEVRATFGPYGVKPKGQKSLAHTCRTVLLLTKDTRFGEETYMMTTVKDREREKDDAAAWENFVEGYLVGKGGWKKVVVKDEVE